MMGMPGWRWSVTVGLLALGILPLVWIATHREKRPRLTSATVEFARDVQPILDSRCVRCHGPTKVKAGLRLDSAAMVRKGSGSGAVVVPGDAENSLLIAVARGDADRPRMPPDGELLGPREIAALKAWIDAGARADEGDDSGPTPSDHWAFRPLAPVPVPSADRAVNPIDAFLAVQPSPPVAKGLLLRRVWIDLVGLSPTRDDLRQFLADDSADAYEKAVDRLLASPQYGERWGRHWMDVWRYSDPDGRKSTGAVWWSNEHVWRWRDWIVDSLNRDKGYDRMVVEMLAGDELDPTSPETLAATGFLVRNGFKLNRNIGLNNTIEHTGKAFLGLTLNCARCHDHKFDPISQRDYYRFRAFFEPHDVRETDMPVEDGDHLATIAHAYDANPKPETWIFVRGDEKTPDRTTPITPGVPRALSVREIVITPVEIASPEARTSTGRRLALARWLTARTNPLTARVAVNHVWTRHFGKPLVETVHDFGVRSKPPVQQPLLDWLAAEFMAREWSMKWLHRQIVTSYAYRVQRDAQRMEAEVVRDSLLRLGGILDLRMGGPPLDCESVGGSSRRSLYHRYSREDKLGLLVTFDAASVDECYRRQQSIAPEQALALMNSDFVWDQARRIAHRLDTETRTPHEFITAAFEHLLSRRPDVMERDRCESFLTSQEQLLANPSRLTPFPGGGSSQVCPAESPRGQAREHLIHALLNHDGFVTVR